MQANHVPRRERLISKIRKLEHRLEASREKPYANNPYWRCVECGIYDPQRSVNEGRHHRGCSIEGLDRQIVHYRRLLSEEEAKS
jgi:hypothetical protein